MIRGGVRGRHEPRDHPWLLSGQRRRSMDELAVAVQDCSGKPYAISTSAVLFPKDSVGMPTRFSNPTKRLVTGWDCNFW
jgi:hypothetical protein